MLAFYSEEPLVVSDAQYRACLLAITRSCGSRCASNNRSRWSTK